MIKVNLVPQDILDRELQRQRTIQAGVILSVLGIVLAGVSLLHYTQAISLDRQLAKDKKELDTLKAIVSQVEQLEQTAQAVRARLNVIEELLVGRPLYPYFMQDVVATFPPGLWITSLNTTPDGGGLKVAMNAKAISSDDVSKWLRTLESSKKFSQPVISAIAFDLDKVSSFSMNLKYNPDLKRH